MDIEITERSDGTWLVGQHNGPIVTRSLSDALDMADRWMNLSPENAGVRVERADSTVERFGAREGKAKRVVRK